jgi:hypothetical protein
MSNKRDLKAFIRYDGSGRVIPGGNILARKAPKVGHWEEIPADECCPPPADTCVTYLYTQGDVSVLISYTDCDGKIFGPTGVNGPIEVTFCALSGTVVIEGRGGTLTYIGTGCTVIPT